MSEIINIEEAENAEQKRVLKLKKPVEFEGKRYEEIDLSGLDELTGRDIRELDRLFKMKGGRVGGSVKEFDSIYIQLVAAKASNLPLELFDCINIRDATALEVEIRNFLIL